MTQGRGLPERTGSTFPKKLFRHQRAHILGAVPIARQRARAQLGQRRPSEQNIFLTIYPVDNSCTGLSGKRKSGPKTGTYGIPKGDWQNITLVGVKVHAKIIRSSQTFIGIAVRMRPTEGRPAKHAKRRERKKEKDCFATFPDLCDPDAIFNPSLVFSSQFSRFFAFFRGQFFFS